MEHKDVIVKWDRNIFDGEKRLLPNSKKMYTQIQDNFTNGNSWSLVFEFDETARIQGYTSKAKVYFLVKDAPHSILKHGFQFDFMDGATKVGSCEINETVAFDFMNEIQARIDLIEDEKKELQTFTNSIEIDNLRPSPEGLRTLFKYINDYPYLFKVLLTLNRKIALEYLDKYFFKIPIQSNAVYHSHLSFFIYHLKNDFGEIKFLDFLSNLPLDVKDNELFKSALDEVN